MPSITVGNGKKNPKAEILKLQKALNAVRFKCGAEDGLWGPKTQDALERFQKVYLSIFHMKLTESLAITHERNCKPF
ncbi:peptidoglycan-binding domain-containing protein [Fictibacillus enclensis]|uniref:peptidoglycan-binding domain-containing protein n=1 Tax=Fictibacillus enclensis TaxID=1017270 RepID=UPI001F0B4437|nr:peptidoglycan-binding domain-containing protein [Fictibacillus enclensis]